MQIRVILSCLISTRARGDGLAYHNYLREQHSSTPPLDFDESLCAFAQRHAEEMASRGTLYHNHTELSLNNQGENIFMAFGYPDPPPSNYTYAIQGWYDEGVQPGYNFSNQGFFENPGTGHFTQVIWKSTKRLCMAHAYTPNRRTVYIVARYSPAGNQPMNFGTNVHEIPVSEWGSFPMIMAKSLRTNKTRQQKRCPCGWQVARMNKKSTCIFVSCTGCSQCTPNLAQQNALNDLNRIHDQFDAVFQSLFGNASLYPTSNVEMSNRVSNAPFRNRFPEMNQRLLKRFSYCSESMEATVASQFGKFNVAKNPKMRIKQVVHAYINWVNLHLIQCEAPYNKQITRQHLVKRIAKWEPFLVTKFCEYVQPEKRFCKSIK